MKNRIITGFLLALTILASCKNSLKYPGTKNAITEASQLADSANVMNAVAGLYNYQKQSPFGMPYSSCTEMLAMSSSADEIQATSTDPAVDVYKEFREYRISPSVGAISTWWNSIYKYIFPTNTIQNTIPNNSDAMSQSFIKQITGEMKVMRAFYYFDLVNMFGGVPLVLNSDYKTTSLLPRASVPEVYAQIISDLTYARDNLKPAYPSAGRFRPNLYTALTLLSKAYLYTQNYEGAYSEADKVIKSGVYSLETDLNKVFLQGSNEAIWQLPTVNGVNDGNRFIPANNTRLPSFIIIPPLLAALGKDNVAPNVDKRFTNWVGKSIVTVGPVATDYYYPYKYKNSQTNTTNIEAAMFFRLGEVYLIRAEAAAQLGKLTEALADVNAIRTRAGLPPSTANPTVKAEVLAAVMKERQVELFCEWGNRWMDLKRTGTAGAVLGALRPTFWRPEGALFPIPSSSIVLDFNLVQNPGYSN